MVILGIDAAWTEGGSSGVALVMWKPGRVPACLCFGRSYGEFIELARQGWHGVSDWGSPVTGGPPDLHLLLNASEHVAGVRVDLVVLDMPISPMLITGRRTADREISRRYGAYWASTHTPSEKRPGPTSKKVFEELEKMGFSWANCHTEQTLNSCPAFLETYPHPAIIEILQLQRRLEYKVSKRGKYWPKIESDQRWSPLAGELDRLRDALARRIDRTDALPRASALLQGAKSSREKKLKGLEDVLDALVCAWAGCEFLQGHCTPFGDDESCIWIPNPGNGG